MGISDRLKKFENTPDIVEETPFSEFITEALTRKISSIPVWYDYDYSKQFELILNFLDNKLNTEFEDLHLSESEKKEIAEEFLKNNKGFGVLDKLLSDNTVEAAAVYPSGAVYVRKDGSFIKTELILSRGQVCDILARFNSENPLAKSVEDNLMVTVIRPPVADNMIIIKKIKDVTENLSDLTADGVITGEIEIYLQNLINSGKNIIVTSEDSEIAGEFTRVLVNSIDYSSRAVVIEDNLPLNRGFDNIAAFSASSLSEKEFMHLLSPVKALKPDYTIVSLADFQKFSAYYTGIDETSKGLITVIQAKGISEAASKLTEIYQRTHKSTEKQAKLHFSSIYDCIIQIIRTEDKNYCLQSVMEITSTKSSSLVMNEVVKYLDGAYVQDLPEVSLPEDDAVIESATSKTFRSRLKK